MEFTAKFTIMDVMDHINTACCYRQTWFDWFMVDGNLRLTAAHETKDDEWLPTRTFTEADFVRGLALWIQENGTSGDRWARVKYLGRGVWDIDGPGADAIVQMAVYGKIVFS
jgi:hypothetical protein